MSDTPPAEDPRSPTPDPEGIPDEEFEKMMKRMDEIYQRRRQETLQNPSYFSRPLTIGGALDAQKKKNTGVEDPRRALANEAASRALQQQQQMARGQDYSALEEMQRRMQQLRDAESRRDQEREKALAGIKQETAPSRTEE